MFRNSPGARVLAICLGWIILAPVLLLSRVIMVMQARSATGGLAGVRIHALTPSKLLLVTFVPPILLFGAWLLARSRPT
jgi:hypothetical protein